jgi:hypothetical protein
VGPSSQARTLSGRECQTRSLSSVAPGAMQLHLPQQGKDGACSQHAALANSHTWWPQETWPLPLFNGQCWPAETFSELHHSGGGGGGSPLCPYLQASRSALKVSPSLFWYLSDTTPARPLNCRPGDLSKQEGAGEPLQVKHAGFSQLMKGKHRAATEATTNIKQTRTSTLT